MKAVTKVVFLSDDGQEYDTKKQAYVGDMTSRLDNLSLHWSGINSQEVAQALWDAGFEITFRCSVEEGV